jgi:hypothetical protein
MTSGPLLYLGAAPTQVAHVPTLTQPHGVRDVLENPPHSRYSGFNLLTLDRASLVTGDSLRVSNGDRKHVELRGDATLIAIAMFDEFLGWGRRDFMADPKANSVAVVEFTHDFVLSYEAILSDYVEPIPENVRFQIGVRGALYTADGIEHRVYLPPGPIRDFDLGYGHRFAPEESFSGNLEIATGAERPLLDVESVAYQLVRRLYNWFGHTDDAIPYTAAGAERLEIQQIKDLR